MSDRSRHRCYTAGVFDKFDEAARRSVFYARYESARVGKRIIDSEHVLLGIFREGDPVTTELWRGFKVIPERVRERFPTLETQVSSAAALPISDDVKAILDYAVQEAVARDNIEVSPAHIVLGMLRIPTCEAAKLLSEHGVEYDVASEAIRIFQAHAKHRAEADARTPVALRHSHYTLLDRFAASMKLRGERHETRQRLMLAIMDAVIATSVGDETFESAEDLRTQMQAALSKKWPGA